MLNFSFPLLAGFPRPTISTFLGNAMIDTGAFLSVLDLSEQVVKDTYGGVLINPEENVFGFTGPGKMPLYRLKKPLASQAAHSRDFSHEQAAPRVANT